MGRGRSEGGTQEGREGWFLSTGHEGLGGPSCMEHLLRSLGRLSLISLSLSPSLSLSHKAYTYI